MATIIVLLMVIASSAGYYNLWNYSLYISVFFTIIVALNGILQPSSMTEKLTDVKSKFSINSLFWICISYLSLINTQYSLVTVSICMIIASYFTMDKVT